MTIKVPGYTIRKLLGEGGMASVYLATQQSLDRPVALKVLKKFDTEAQVQRFFNEGKIIASLNQRNIITIYDLGEIDGRCFLAMEYLEGGDLKQRIDTGLAADEALELVKLLAQALDFVHQKGVIHRDIKPENILFRKDGSPVLTDFGVAKQVESDVSHTMDGSAIGSPHYLSPEQAEQKKLDPRTDIYSLGIIFYEMLTGQKPFQGDSPIEIIIAHLTTESPPLPKNLKHFQELVDLMIAKDPGDRFASAAELLGYLGKLRSSNAGRRFKGAIGKVLAPKEKESKPAKVEFPPIIAGSIINKRLGLGLMTAAGLSLVAYFYLSQPQPHDEPQLQPLAASKDPVAVPLTQSKVAERESSPPATPTPVPLSREKSVRELLADAKAIVNGPNLSFQALQEAHAIYKQVQKRAPNNQQAFHGITRLAPMMLGIQLQIDTNLAAAEKALREFRLASPPNNNALFYFQKVRDLDAENADAQQGNTKVADAYADLVESALKANDYAKAKEDLDMGLSLDPASARLLALKERTAAFSEAR